MPAARRAHSALTPISNGQLRACRVTAASTAVAHPRQTSGATSHSAVVTMLPAGGCRSDAGFARAGPGRGPGGGPGVPLQVTEGCELVPAQHSAPRHFANRVEQAGHAGQLDGT